VGYFGGVEGRVGEGRPDVGEEGLDHSAVRGRRDFGWGVCVLGEQAARGADGFEGGGWTTEGGVSSITQPPQRKHGAEVETDRREERWRVEMSGGWGSVGVCGLN